MLTTWVESVYKGSSNRKGKLINAGLIILGKANLSVSVPPIFSSAFSDSLTQKVDVGTIKLQVRLLLGFDILSSFPKGLWLILGLGVRTCRAAGRLLEARPNPHMFGEGFKRTTPKMVTAYAQYSLSVAVVFLLICGFRCLLVLPLVLQPPLQLGMHHCPLGLRPMGRLFGLQVDVLSIPLNLQLASFLNRESFLCHIPVILRARWPRHHTISPW
jgi:hypothetical protein